MSRLAEKPLPGAGRCPRCGSTRVARDEQSATNFYGQTIEGCGNPACRAFWEPYDPAQLLEKDLPRTSSFIEPCDNCAFRPGSFEQRQPEFWKDLMVKLKANGHAGFFCHKGVPINVDSEDGFDYPRDRVTGKPAIGKLRYCRGFLKMLGAHWAKSGNDFEKAVAAASEEAVANAAGGAP